MSRLVLLLVLCIGAPAAADTRRAPSPSKIMLWLKRPDLRSTLWQGYQLKRQIKRMGLVTSDEQRLLTALDTGLQSAIDRTGAKATKSTWDFYGVLRLNRQIEYANSLGPVTLQVAHLLVPDGRPVVNFIYKERRHSTGLLGTTTEHVKPLTLSSTLRKQFTKMTLVTTVADDREYHYLHAQRHDGTEDRQYLRHEPGVSFAERLSTSMRTAPSLRAALDALSL